MSESPGRCCDGECARAIEGATVQIELALRETYAPVAFLGETIRRLAAILRDIDSEAPGSEPAATREGIEARLQELRSGLSASIERLQFHDRMVQHLSHVRDYLASIANQLDRDGSYGEDRSAGSAEPWTELNTRLRERLISDAERELFDLVLGSGRTPRVSEAKRNDYAAQGSIELF